MTYLTQEEFNQYIEYMSKADILTIDTEGTLNHPFSETWGLSLASRGVSEYFGFNHMLTANGNLPQEWLPKIVYMISNHHCLNFHHAKHDLRALRNLGIDYKGLFYDTMLMAHMVDENIPSKELDYLCNINGLERKRQSEVQTSIAKAFGWDYIPLEIIRDYGSNDAFITENLFNDYYPDFCNQGFDNELWDWEQKLVRLLMDIEDNGILIDQDLSEKELNRGLSIMKEIEKSLGINPGSPQQLGKLLIDELGLPVVKRNKPTKKNSKGNPSFDKEAMRVYDELLSQINDSRAEQILTYRGWLKTTSSNYKAYLDLLGSDGRVRCNYKMHGTVSGRLSCEKPNLQQIPRESSNDWNGHLKKVFITEPGRTAWNVDYAQLEFRLAAAYAKEEKLLNIFADPQSDIFKSMSQELNMSRQNTKTLNYTIQFGGGAQRLHEVFGVSLLAAKAIINNYYNNYQGLARFNNLAQQRCKENGTVKLWTGRMRHFPDPYRMAHKAPNSVIQGGAFEIVKRQMIRAHEAGLNNDECRMDLQVHDSVRFDIENGKEHIYLPEIKRVFEDVQPDFGVKFRVDIKKWGEE